MRVITHSADEVRALRRTLGLTQTELARRLEVSRRTIIRGEQRGIEIPWYSTSDYRHVLYSKWRELQQLAADLLHSRDRESVTSRGAAGGDTQKKRIRAKVSPARE